jgi:hypothetical protein
MSYLEDKILALRGINLKAHILGQHGGRGVLGPGEHDRAAAHAQRVMQAVIDLQSK